MNKLLYSFVAFTLTVASLVAAPQAIVFDFGGVLTGRPNREIVVDFLRSSLNLSKEEFEQANREKRAAIKAGKTDEEFWQTYAQDHHIVLSSSWTKSFRNTMVSALNVNPKMFDLVQELKEKQLSVGMLSNIDTRYARLIRDFGLYAPFEPCLLSCEIGVDKPDAKAFELLIVALQLPPQDIVYIDDRADNVASALQLGIDALVFISEAQLRLELAERGVFPPQ